MSRTIQDQAADSSTTEGKRRRAVVACTSCRRRKIRCDASKPHCGNCSRAGLSCTYPPEGRRKRARVSGSDQYADEVQSRLNRMESMISLLLEKEGLTFNGSSTAKKGSLPRSRASKATSTDSPLLSESSDASDSEDISHSDVSDTEDAEDGLESEETNAEKRDEGSFSGGADTDDPRDVLKLKARRAPFVFKIGEFEPLVAYSFGFTLLLLSPKGMKWLCSRIGNEELGKEAELFLSSLWKRKDVEMNLIELPYHDITELNATLVERGFNMVKHSDSETVRLLLNEEDLEKLEKLCNPHNDYSKLVTNSPYSILYPALVMVATSPKKVGFIDLSDFSPAYLAEQSANAYKYCMQKVSQLTWFPTTFLLLRLLILLIYIMSHNTTISRIRSLLSITISRSLDLGLHCDEGSRYLPASEQRRRALVWALVQDLDIKISSLLSLMPIMLHFGYEPQALLRYEDDRDGDLNIVKESMGLNHIYAEVYIKVFSRKARKQTVKQMLLNIVKLDAKLTHWKDSLSPSFKNKISMLETTESEQNDESRLGNRGSRKLEDLLEGNTFNLDRDICSIWFTACTLVCYYNIKMLIYSIPAFSPSCLNVFENDEGGVPPQLLNSIDNTADAAKASLKYAFNASPLYSQEFLAAVATNAFSALFLKQIRDPMHATNNEDLAQIYQYMTRFQKFSNQNAHLDVQGIMKIWSIFSCALTQLNREYSKTDKTASNPNGQRAAHNAPDSCSGKPNLAKEHEHAMCMKDPMHESCDSASAVAMPSKFVDLQDPQKVSRVRPRQDWNPSYDNLPHDFANNGTMKNGVGDQVMEGQTRPVQYTLPSAIYPIQTASSQYSAQPVHGNVQSHGASQVGNDVGGMPMNQISNLQSDIAVMTHQDSEQHINDPFEASYSSSKHWMSPDSTGNLWDTFNGLTGTDLDQTVFNPPMPEEVNAGDTLSNCTIC